MMDEIDNHAIILLDEQGNIETWNKGAEKIKGYTASEIVGRNFRVFYPEADCQAGLPAQLLAEAAATGKVYHEGWRLRQDKTRFWGAVTITASRNEQGQLIGFAKITRDLSERMAAETTIRLHAQDLETRNKELEQFVYIASHDLQEPLLNVGNFVELLQLEYADSFDDGARLYLDIINQSTYRMRNLIKGLLDYARIGREKTFVATDCQELVDFVKEDLTAKLALTAGTLRYSQLPQVMVYPTELRQLFQNLICNALKFTKPGQPPVVTVAAEMRGKYWQFSVNDNGIGIEPAYREKIFKIFQRLHTRETYEGNGIGLAHSKKIVEMHGGELWVESVLGAGSTFFFTIPVHQSGHPTNQTA
ncbi:sensor histidine kinase [Spirosoma rhododendri]|nr:ATP-binding protein [Spirosoma rhododendri]